MPALQGFEDHKVQVQSKVLGSEIEIFCKKAGSGPPLLLLHGYPQTHHIWHKIAPQLAEKYTVVVSDLRGYGQSSKPKGSDSHEEYSKKEMASDQVQLMEHFGFDSFYLVGHDRGARVSHRLALDYPQKVKKLIILDILPTVWMYEHTDMQFAAGYWHWFFLIQPSPGPENMIGGAPMAYWKCLEQRLTHSLVAWDEEAEKAYQDALLHPEAIHSTCEDYRAAATIDLDHDRASREKGEKLKISEVKVIWGSKGMIEKLGGGIKVWQEFCEDTVEVTGGSYDCGHYIPEEKPEELLKEILEFMV